MAKIRCPFCFESFGLQDVHFRCIEPHCQGWAQDRIYAEKRGLPPDRKGHVFGAQADAQRRLLGTLSARCDVCQKESDTRLCPECHFELSHDAGQVPQKTIAVVGGRFTGKSHYIASVIAALSNEVGANFHLAVRLLGDDTQIRWEQDFYRPLFEKKIRLQPTQPGEVNASVKAPLALRLTFHNGLWKQVLNISVFDTSGEDMLRSASMKTQARYIPHADGIIFLIDPLQLVSIRQLLPSVQDSTLDTQAHPDRVLRPLIELLEMKRKADPLRRLLAMRGGIMSKFSLPVAFTLSKTDVLEPILAPGSPLARASEHSESVNLTDMQSISTEVEHSLRRWGLQGFCENVVHNFSHYQYFGVSSLGYQPEEHSQVVTNPLRVEDPLLWLLYKMNFVPGKKLT